MNDWRQSYKWQRVRRLVMRRDGFRCRFCRAPAVEAYHMSFRHGWNNPAAIVSVCRPCLRMCRMGLRRHIVRKLASRRDRISNSRLAAALVTLATAFWEVHWIAGVTVLAASVIVLANEARRR